MDETASKDRALIRDKWFWSALCMGVVTAWLLAMIMGRSVEWSTGWAQWRIVVWLILLYPVIEEWLFRGLLQPWFLKARFGKVACCGISMANVLTSLLFALAHLYVHAVLWAVLVIIPSLLFGWFRDRYQSILPGTLLHSGYNFAYFAFFGLQGTLIFPG